MPHGQSDTESVGDGSRDGSGTKGNGKNNNGSKGDESCEPQPKKVKEEDESVRVRGNGKENHLNILRAHHPDHTPELDGSRRESNRIRIRMLTCSICNVSKAETDGFSTTQRRNGSSAKCIVCIESKRVEGKGMAEARKQSTEARRRERANEDKMIRDLQERTCSECNVMKNRESFHLEQLRCGKRSKCKECLKEIRAKALEARRMRLKILDGLGKEMPTISVAMRKEATISGKTNPGTCENDHGDVLDNTDPEDDAPRNEASKALDSSNIPLKAELEDVTTSATIKTMVINIATKQQTETGSESTGNRKSEKKYHEKDMNKPPRPKRTVCTAEGALVRRIERRSSTSSSSAGDDLVDFPNDQIATLPDVPYERSKITIMVVSNASCSDRAVDEIRTKLGDRNGRKSFQYLGFDTETRPKFHKGGSNNPPAMIQLGTATTAYLFRLSFWGMDRYTSVMTESLKNLLSDSNVIKVGIGIHNDIVDLKRVHGSDCCGDGTSYLDLGHLVKLRWPNIQRAGLRNLAATVLGLRLSKAQQMKNWEMKQLTPDMEACAATDALVALDLLAAIVE